MGKDKTCPECGAELELYVTASFRGGQCSFGLDGYAYSDLEVLEDEGFVVCSAHGIDHFKQDFSEWQSKD